MAKTDIGGVWRTVGGRRIFIKDGEDLATAMKNSGKFGNKENKKIPQTLNNRKNLVDYVREQIDVDLEEAATENQFAPRRGLNIDSRKLTINELNSVKMYIELETTLSIHTWTRPRTKSEGRRYYYERIFKRTRFGQ